ncbi:ribonuclease J [Tannockella kyphosi]|uniref:ribonuclease J n=1 Tax=Tannockella kyphosi TaxID=2899121 RepID=UPI002012CE3E|nr:ribonuclease J [Tannockella kyphosi]
MKKDNIRILPLGGQAELGKSMYCIEINDKIIILDAGFRFPEIDKLGVDIIIPSYDYLIENKKKVKAIIISHGHDDVMAGLPYVLQVVNVPVYAPNLTADLIEQMMDRYNRHNSKINYKLNRVKRNGSITIDGIPIEFFPVTHSIPGSVGIAIWTSEGYIVYTGEFIIDFGAPEGFGCDIQKMMEIAKKGVLAMLVESSYATKDGYTSPKHKLTPLIENIFEETEGRMIISTYAQNIFRTKEILELARKYNRRVVFYGRDKYDSTNSIVRIGQKLKKAIIDISPDIIAFKGDINKPGVKEKLVVMLTGSPRTIYHDICDIIDGGDEFLKLEKDDTFIVASPVLPGTEKIATRAQNELYKTDSKIHLLKSKSLYSMHASQEDIKVLIQIFNPTYFIPVKGEYQHFVANMKIAKGMNIADENIVILDNGERITFKDGKLAGFRDAIEVEDVMIDGIGVGDVGEKVIDDRIQLSNDGVVIIGLTIDSKTKDIVTTTDVQSRGFIYLRDSEYIIRTIIEMSEEQIATLKKDPKLEVVEIRQIIKDKVSRYISKETGKRPVILPVVIEV